MKKTIPYNSESNGKAERANRVLLERARSLLYESKLPLKFWAEAINCSTQVSNVTPRKRKEKNPIRNLTGNKPKLNYLKKFGCVAYFHVPKTTSSPRTGRIQIPVLELNDVQNQIPVRRSERLKSKLMSVHLVNNVPNSYFEAENSANWKNWKLAMENELDSSDASWGNAENGKSFSGGVVLLEFDKSMTIKDLIIGSENYDKELTKNIHSTIVEDRKVREKTQEEQKEKLRIEEQREKSRIQEREERLRFEQLSETKFLVKEVSKFIHRFDLKEDISLYLKLFERQAQRLNIDQENWVSHLLGLLPTEVSHIIAREPDDKANSYEHVKDLLLKRFKLTPEKFRQLFVTHQKAPERTWIDFNHELNTYFNGWIDGLKIDTFNKLSDLILTDQLKRKTPFEFKEYYLDECANMNSLVQLAEKLEKFEDFKRTLKQKSSSPFVKKQEFKFTEKNRRYGAPGKFEYNRKDKKFPASMNYNKHYEAPVTKYESVQRYQDSAQKGYYNKNYEKYSNHNAFKHAQTNYSKSQKFKEPPKETCTLIVKEGLRTKEIFLER
ncbi:uncharacterized protein TNCV_1010311 [Trichonephila clavipes]|nr:uncharacterized protein TNCV_1010311 [Trichonephila clavipes]